MREITRLTLSRSYAPRRSVTDVTTVAKGIPLGPAQLFPRPECFGAGRAWERGHDERVLTEIMKQLLADKQLYRRIASEGRKTVEARFSLRSLKEGIEQVYNKMFTQNDV